MSSGIILALNATYTADNDGICQGQTAKTLTINGSLTSAGAYLAGTNWGQKINIISAGDDSTKTFTVSGLFFGSTTTGDTTTTIAVTGANAGTATSSLYAQSITSIVCSTTTASSVTVGPTATALALPVGLNQGSLYQLVFGGAFGGASVTVERYQADLSEWVAVLDSAKTAAAVTNVEIPAGTRVRATVSSGSTTTAIGVVAEPIQKTI